MENPPPMITTPGITEPELSADPLMTEGEATIGPNDVNPYNSVEEKEYTEEIERKQKDSDLYKTVPAEFDFRMQSPTAGNDPFIFDDIGDDVQNVQLPFANGFDPSGFEL